MESVQTPEAEDVIMMQLSSSSWKWAFVLSHPIVWIDFSNILLKQSLLSFPVSFTIMIIYIFCVVQVDTNCRSDFVLISLWNNYYLLVGHPSMLFDLFCFVHVVVATQETRLFSILKPHLINNFNK